MVSLPLTHLAKPRPTALADLQSRDHWEVASSEKLHPVELALLTAPVVALELALPMEVRPKTVLVRPSVPVAQIEVRPKIAAVRPSVPVAQIEVRPKTALVCPSVPVAQIETAVVRLPELALLALALLPELMTLTEVLPKPDLLHLRRQSVAQHWDVNSSKQQHREPPGLAPQATVRLEPLAILEPGRILEMGQLVKLRSPVELLQVELLQVELLQED